MTRIPRYGAATLSMALVALLATALSASPFVSVGEGQNVSWTDGINNGNVQAAQDSPFVWPSPNEVDFYAAQGVPGSVIYHNAQLTPDLAVSDGAEVHQSLVMSWDLDTADDLSVAAWDYVYDIDPDLTGKKILFSLLAPPGIWDVSIELVDAAGRWRSWFISGPPPTWGNYMLDPSVGIQGPFNTFLDDPLFDLTMVVGIRFDEAGMFSPTFPAPPAGAPPLPGWNAWNHVRISPEPTTFGLLVVGAVCCLLRRRRA